MGVNLLSIGKRIFKIRNSLGLTQDKMAKVLGISQKHISQMEKGTKIPSKHLIRLIGLSFDISEAWLNDGRGEMFVPLEKQLKEKLEYYGKQIFWAAVQNVLKKYGLEGKRPGCSSYATDDLDLNRMLETLCCLWSAGDSRLRGWIEIQFERAFPTDVVEEFKKK
jgi:transcriptional regulator with XRE-family HTH domain